MPSLKEQENYKWELTKLINKKMDLILKELKIKVPKNSKKEAEATKDE
jgi:hypothetical protein